MSAMAADNDPPPNSSQKSLGEPTIFSAVLTPHRSLGRQGFVVLMLVLGVCSFVTGMIFLLAGAWPVFGFCGLDVLLVYWAFRVSYRRAKAYEQVTVTPSELTVRQVSHQGRISECGARGVRHRAAVPGLARPTAGHRRLPRAAGEGKLRARAFSRSR
jgi:uncharacterized membrane protein